MSHANPGQDTGESPSLREAIQWLQRGDTVKAEEIVLQAAKDTEARFGRESIEAAGAQNDLGTLLLYLSQVPAAIEAFRKAAAVDIPSSEQATRFRLTYLMNLGFALQRAGELEEAERVLRQGLTGRQDFYGRDHPGYAFGLEPLAELLLARGKLEEAEQLIEETVENFWRNGHARVATALAVRGRIYKAAGKDMPAFDGLERLPDHIIEEMATTLLQQIDEQHLSVVDRQLLHELFPILVQRFGEEHPLALNTLTGIANIERWLGDHAARVTAIRRVIAIWDRMGQQERALQSVLGLALAQGEAGHQDEAEATYRESLKRADAIGRPALRSQALRNFGLFLADRDRRPEGELLLREAVNVVAPDTDTEMRGRAEVALGVFLQHGGQMEPARALLTEALRRLDPAHPDAICARSHVNAIEKGGSCGCGDLGEASAEALREFILARVPPGLLQKLDVGYANQDWQIQVHLQKEPTEQELEQLNRIITHALEEFRKRVRQAP
jgi:tetratricopeptide (TPR) repeat protein